MSWMFVVDLVFYAVLGILTFPLLVLIVALLSGRRFDAAYALVKGFLTRWAEIPGKDFVDKTLKVSGVSAMLFLLAFGAYVANRVGDWALPKTAPAFAYVSGDTLRWSTQHKGEWGTVVSDLRTLTKIEHDRQKWEEAKAQFGRYDVRFFRVLTVFCALLLASALVALARKRSVRAAAVAGSVAVALMLSHVLWIEREEQYMDNLLGRYMSEYSQQHAGAFPPKPAHFPDGKWPVRTVAAKLAPEGAVVKTSMKKPR
jgi:hypothetical protein